MVVIQTLVPFFALSLLLLLNFYSMTDPTSTNWRDAEIIIIGAGISGLEAANRLINKYKFNNVIILEARNRIGGRIHPITIKSVDGTSQTLKMGAEFIHHRGHGNPVFFELGKSLNLILPNSKSKQLDKRDWIYISDTSNPNISNEMEEAFERFMQSTEEKWEELEMSDRSVGQMYNIAFDNFIRENTWNNNERSQLRNWAWGKKLFPYEEDIVISERGYADILDYYRRQIPSSHIRLKPEICRYGSSEKIFIVYPEVWTGDVALFAFIETEKNTPSNFIHTLDVHPWHSNILMCFMIGSHLQTLHNLTDDQIVQAINDKLRPYQFKTATFQKPSKIIRTNWENDPFSYGSYSWYSMASNELPNPVKDLSQPIILANKPVILFAGEATNFNMFQTTHGAFISGKEKPIDYKDITSSSNRIIISSN